MTIHRDVLYITWNISFALFRRHVTTRDKCDVHNWKAWADGRAIDLKIASWDDIRNFCLIVKQAINASTFKRAAVDTLLIWRNVYLRDGFFSSYRCRESTTWRLQRRCKVAHRGTETVRMVEQLYATAIRKFRYIRSLSSYSASFFIKRPVQ